MASVSPVPVPTPDSSTTHPVAAAPAEAPPSGWAWVPVRSLAPRHRARIAEHLLALTEQDRHLRFGYAANDAQLGAYVDALDFDRDEVFGIFNRRLELIAMAHLAHPALPRATASNQPFMSEFGVSVLPRARGRGFGKRLFEHAMLHARNRGVRTLFIHALSENTVMLKIARDAGGTVRRDGAESDAYVELPDDTIASHVGQLVEHQAAELDYQFKLHAHRVGNVLDVLAELKGRIGDAARIAEE